MDSGMCILAAAVLALRSTPMNPIGSCDWNHSSLKSIEDSEAYIYYMYNWSISRSTYVHTKHITYAIK